jgi:lipoprotein-anchoring transpeptidase ErfK/SrfK
VSPKFVRVAFGAVGLATAAVALAQASGNSEEQSAPKQERKSEGANSRKNWVAPGTPGSRINGQLFHAQVLLDGAGFSSGVIDGRSGSSFKQALRGFQESRGIKTSGELDRDTKVALLQANKPAVINVKLTPEDVVSNFVYPFPRKPEEQARLKFLGYRNMLEKLAERYHTDPDTIIALNGPEARIGVGQTLKLPNVLPKSRDYGDVKADYAHVMSVLNVEGAPPQGDHIVVDKSDAALKVYEAGINLIGQFPVTTCSSHDPLPIGEWMVTTYSFRPPFNYQPDLFWDVSDDKAEQKLPPGPNGPVGVAWLDLTKEHYGIHGTPEPSTIGKTQSHGCLRLTNWDVLRLSRMLKPGFTAKFQA